MDLFATARRVWAAATGLLVLAAAGCSVGEEYVVSWLDLTRTGWDTLAVEVQFERRMLFGQSALREPAALHVYLFNAAYDTLYAGTDRRIPIADARLGDRERLMVEVCGAFDAVTICEQSAVTASPKRLRLEHDITYPEDAAYERGSYELRFVVERQDFASDRWQRLSTPQRVRGYLLAYVGETQQEAVKVPFSRRQGRFNLRSLPHFRDFRYHLTSRLLDEREAPVFFDVYAGLNGQPALRLASIEKRVRSKDPEERALEVRYYVEQATERILEALDVADHRRNARAYIDDWSFNPVTGAYLVELEIVWQTGRRIFGRTDGLAGLLEVREDGAEARFLLRDADDRARRHWRERVRGNHLTLGTLDRYVPDRETDLAARRHSD